MKSKLFKDFEINEKFHNGKSYHNINAGRTEYWIEWQKINKSEAICTNQIGFGNIRGVGSIKRFYPNITLFPLEKEV